MNYPGLYRSGFTPPRTPKDLVRISMMTSGQGQSGDILRRYGVPADFGDPAEAVGWFDENDRLMQLLADYANGKRILWRRKARRWDLRYSDRPVRSAAGAP